MGPAESGTAAPDPGVDVISRSAMMEKSFFLLCLAHHSMLATCFWLEYCQALFSELSFSIISEYTTDYIFTLCVGYIISHGIDAR